MTIYSLFIRHFRLKYINICIYDKPNRDFKRFSLYNMQMDVKTNPKKRDAKTIFFPCGPAGPNGTVAR